MNAYLFFLIAISLININFFVKNSNNDYLSKDNSNCIKGIFVLIVFYSHLATYFEPLYSKDFLMLNFRNFLGQLMVAPFLFYSGYGVYESIKKKKKSYINSIPKKRILKTWFNFVLAIILFFITSLLLDKNYSLSKIVLSFIGWDSIGNSNWYIFSIIFMYFITFISFKIINNNDKSALILNILITIIYILIMNIYKDEYWFNTILCYNFGMVYSYNKTTIDKILLKNKKYILILPLVIISFIFFRYYLVNFWAFEIYSILFITLIVVLSLKIKFNSPILKWFGENIFYIYILQRIPMLLFAETRLINFVYKYSLACFISTILLSVIFKKLSNRLLKCIDK